MPSFAIVEDGKVINVIMAKSHGDAESVVGKAAITVIDGEPGINWTYEPEGWRPPPPFPSWMWQDGRWQPPTPMPDEGGPYTWDEDSLTWVSSI